ncbi:MAG: hypothetical protein HY078_08135 [Elusimicrobia bacterium]|nr:hypothetical protein [Elusimicrobiota bacterium]
MNGKGARPLLFTLLCAYPASRACADGSYDKYRTEFRCNLKDLPSRPRVLLVGENHAGRASIAYKRIASRVASTGRAHVGFEAGAAAYYPGSAPQIARDFEEPNTESSRFYGLDSPFAHGLILTYVMSDGENSTYSDMAAAGHFLRKNEYFKWSFDAAKEKGLRRGDERRVGEFLDREAAMDADTARPDAYRAIDQDPDAFREVMKKVNERYVALANSQYLPALGIDKKLQPYGPNGRIKFNRDGTMDGDETTKRIVDDVRDRDMAIQIQDMYCAAARENKPVIAVVGLAHVRGIRQILETASGKTISVETFDTLNLRSTERALDATVDALPPGVTTPRPLEERTRRLELPRDFDPDRRSNTRRPSR